MSTETLKLQHVLREAIDTCWYATGLPPKLIRANRAFKSEVVDEIERENGQFGINGPPPDAPYFASNEFQYYGVLVRCDLPTRETTVISFADR